MTIVPREISGRELLTIILLLLQILAFSYWLGMLNQRVSDINLRLMRVERIVLKLSP